MKKNTKHNKIHQTGWKEGYAKGRKEALNEAIAIFEKLDGPMTQYPIILELRALRNFPPKPKIWH